MKQTDKPNEERQVRVEHIFCAADDVVSGPQRACKIDGIERLEQQQSASDPGEDEWALQPQTNSDEDVADVAEEQEVLCPVLPPIERRPNDQPKRPDDLEPERHAPSHGTHCMR